MTDIAVDTSVAVPLLMSSHPAHDSVRAWADGHSMTLSGHALAETYSVLTRLPGDARLSPGDAVTLIDASFGDTVPLEGTLARTFHHDLARFGIAGGAVYDGLVALAARRGNLRLATRDARARATYEAIGVDVELVA